MTAVKTRQSREDAGSNHAFRLGRHSYEVLDFINNDLNISLQFLGPEAFPESNQTQPI